MSLPSPEEFKSALLNCLNLGSNPSELSNLINETNLNYTLLESELESTRAFINNMLEDNEQVRQSNGELLLKTAVKPSIQEDGSEPFGIDSLLDNLQL